MNKVWKLKKIDENIVKEYMNEFNISYITAKLLLSKDISKERVQGFLSPSIDKLYDPFLLQDMDKLVDRIIYAKEKKEKVAIYGDYDVDGITSITILYSFLKDLGINITYYLPDRQEEGYGLNKEALFKLKEDGVNLVITVDCGISAIEEAKYANEIGLSLCITDHHECSNVLPEAVAVVNPKRTDSKYPFSFLAGVGVAFKVVTALAIKLNMDSDSYLKFLDIVAVGTIADIVPLVDENRVITSNGLKMLKNTKNEGLKALMKASKISVVDSESVSFGLAPRINASGRMADAKVSVKMLLSKNSLEAYNYALTLNEQNTLRQEVEKKILDEAIREIEKQGLDKKRSIVIEGNNWHQGVIGIVASKLTEKYMKPVILLSVDGKKAKGSGRIPQGISLYEALCRCSDLITEFGGHELAAGLTIETKNIDSFKEKFEQVIAEMKPDDFVKEIDIDMELVKKLINFDTVKEIENLAPFGQKNKRPVFMYKNLKVVSISTLKDNKHLKLKLQDEDFVIDALFFKAGERRDEIKLSDKIDVAFTLSSNEYMGYKSLQFILLDFKKSIN